MKYKKGDLVTRKSYNHDLIFKIINITEDKYILKGIEMRLYADSPEDDLELFSDRYSFDTFYLENDERSLEEYFYLPPKILHIDGDSEYLERCMKYYQNHNVKAIGKKISEVNMADNIIILLKKYRPDLLVISGHDSYNKNSNNPDDIKNYRNSLNFVKTIKAARKYEKSHDKLLIIAGACQSFYEELIKAGADFASSPKRINIHALDPAIIATSIALTKRTDVINLIKVLNKTKYGKDGMGGVECHGLMYVGYPR